MYGFIADGTQILETSFIFLFYSPALHVRKSVHFSVTEG
jgi:hypothetical protein